MNIQVYSMILVDLREEIDTVELNAKTQIQMPYLNHQLILDKCPHCKVAKPLLQRQSNYETQNSDGENPRYWGAYICSQCGGVTLAWSYYDGEEIQEMYPESKIVDPVIPEQAREYLKQAIDSLHAPAGSIMLSSSSVDAMLKAKGYTKDGLYPRIKKAVEDQLITDGMAKWAHLVRLEANEQRHADETFSMPTEQEAQRVIDFTLAFAEFLFVLPAKVEQGISNTIQ